MLLQLITVHSMFKLKWALQRFIFGLPREVFACSNFACETFAVYVSACRDLVRTTLHCRRKNFLPLLTILWIIDVIDVARFISIFIISLILFFVRCLHVCTNSIINNKYICERYSDRKYCMLIYAIYTVTEFYRQKLILYVAAYGWSLSERDYQLPSKNYANATYISEAKYKFSLIHFTSVSARWRLYRRSVTD